jgi:hypothetical protein
MFCEENYSCNSQPTQYKKKIDKYNFGENHKKKNTKTMWGNTVVIQNV